MSPTADEFKALGNKALQAGNVSEAIEQYTKAINADGSNHVYYSNRSAAYLKSGDANNALEDANACIGLNPGFAKGYSRKGAALHSLKRFNDSIAAYNDGLAKFPGDAGLTKGLQDVQREKENPGGTAAAGGAGGGLFGPQMMAQMAMNPQLRPYLNDPDIMGKISLLQKNPNLMPTIMNDPKMMEFLGIMMGQSPGATGGATAEETPPTTTPPASTSTSEAPPKKQQEEKAPEPMEVEEDLSGLSPEERKKAETKKAAIAKKMEGNALYKAKKMDEALAAYDEAIAIDPTNMTFVNNKSAVYFTLKEWDTCIEHCLKAVEIGKANQAPYEDRAKALARCAKAYQKKKDLVNAIEYCNLAQLEYYDKGTQRLLKTLELEKRKADTLAYQDDEKAEEAKQRGNEHFRNKDWGEAVKEYEDAVKRAPKNAPIRNNLSAALCKIMDFSGAKREIEKAIELDPQYVKAWARKGDIETVLKEYHKALESYKKGLELDNTNTTCSQGLRKVTQLINYGRQNMTEEQKKGQAARAMDDPEIRNILTDPVIQQVLRDFNENPNAAQQAMLDVGVRAKINKLIAAGVIETR